RRPHLRGFVMAAQPRQSWSSCDLSGPDTPGPIRPLTPLPRQSRHLGTSTPRAPALLISRLVSWVDDLWCRAIGAGV
ncbi:hypothetical protein OSH64_26585, partial [Mycobacterium ulcerans]